MRGRGPRSWRLPAASRCLGGEGEGQGFFLPGMLVIVIRTMGFFLQKSGIFHNTPKTRIFPRRRIVRYELRPQVLAT